MDKRYQIFVSSTFSDLQEERQAVVQALLSLDHFPAGMELFPASDDDQWALIKGVIDDSDYYLVVIGGRYGSLSDKGISYTEMEFDYALAAAKPMLAFLHEHPEEIAAKKTDQSDKLRGRLEKFKQKVRTGRTVKFWNNADQLKAQVIQSVSAETKRNPQEGWIRAGRSSDPAVTEALRQEIDRLRAALNAATTTAPSDTLQYAGGTDSFRIRIIYMGEGFKHKILQIEVSWYEIFREVAPILMDEASERQMRTVLSEQLPKYDFSWDGGTIIEMVAESFETIKVQLFALGLIKKSEKKHVPSDTQKYWTLTPYGQNTLMKLRAIPRKQQSSEPEPASLKSV